MDENEIKVWRMLTTAASIVLCTMITSCATSCMYTDYRISQDIAKGANPITSACAHSPNGMDKTVCGAAVVREN